MKDNNLSSPFEPIESDIPQLFTVRIPAVVIEHREQKVLSQSEESEYFTVNYKQHLTRRKRSLFLLTMLDSIIRRVPLVLSLADYLILEDLISKITELDQIEREKQEEFRKPTEYLLGMAILFLKVIPLQTRANPVSEIEGQRETLIRMAEDLEYFSFSEDRVYGSRVSNYFPGNVVEFTVEIPLSIKKDNFYVPYSSYCKGYGESHPKRIGTPIDWEIDGEDIYNQEIPGSIIYPRDLYQYYIGIYDSQ